VRLSLFAAAIFLALAVPTLAVDDEALNLYEWTQRAPIVIRATSLGEDGKYVDVLVTEVFRGDVQPEEVLMVDIRQANRERDKILERRATRLDSTVDFLLLLQEAYIREKDGKKIYTLVRGVHGVRPLPAESEEVWLSAVRRFVEIHEMPSEAQAWRQLGMMLEESDPLMLETALQEYIKFRRGDGDLLLTILPILDHPSPLLRQKTTVLISQILDRKRGEEIPEQDAVRTELIARARRDESVPVRVAATEALAIFPGDEIDAVLKQISDDDPDQDVRYAAQMVLLERRQDKDRGS
jgi:hypothetical protein